MSVHWLWPSAFAVAFVLTRAIMLFATKQRLLDFPNPRSSHSRPVPRGGGVAVFVVFAAGMLTAGLAGMAEPRLLIAALGGGGLVALIGLVDDYRDVAAGWRLAMHTLAAVWALYWLGGIPAELLPGVPAVLVNVIGVVCIVWLLNLYNFMDGIDGLAGIETVTVCFAHLVLYACCVAADSAWVSSALLAAAVAGFLFWNYPPARIFLGDTGSGFLGFMMAILCVQAAHVQPVAFWAWIILLGVFVVDSGVTLARRIVRRRRLNEAHRSHAYQFAARKFGGHARVSLAVGAINLAWLLPMAFLAISARVPAVPVLLVAYAPLVWLALRFKAGAAELQEV